MLTSFMKVVAVASVAALASGPSSGGDIIVPPQENATVPSVTVFGSRQAEGVLGKEVRSTADESLGRIIDVIVDREGKVRAAVIDFGGFLGVASHRVAIPISQFSEISTKHVVLPGASKDELKRLPEFKYLQ